MQVKIKFHDTLAETEKAVLFLISEREQWIPKKLIKIKGNFIICPKFFADKLELRYSFYTHIPQEIEPKFNQRPINELIYNPRESC